MEARDPAEAQESVQELAVDMGTTPEHEEDLKSNLAGNLVEHSEPIGFTTVVESVSPAELVNKLSDELPDIVIQEMLSEESNLEVAPAQVLKPCKEDEIHVKEMKMMEAALQGAAQQAQAKADEIVKLTSENEQLKTVIEDLRVYALTKERDTLRREQNNSRQSIHFQSAALGRSVRNWILSG
ncbi:unnamed protein product [Amaranthus hypochondriacus]